MSDRPLLNRRLEGHGSTIFAEMSALAVRTGAINLGQGFPDTDGPEEVREAAVRALRDGRGNQYPPGPGVPELRTADHRAPTALLRPRRSTPTPRSWSPRARPRPSPPRCSPCWSPATRSSPSSRSTTPTPPRIAMAGAARVPLTLRAPGLPPRPGRAAGRRSPPAPGCCCSTARTTRPAWCSPARSSTAIAELAVEHDLLVVTDEVYEHLVFDGEHIPLISPARGCASARSPSPRPGKTFSFTGWKVGWVTALPGARRRGPLGEAVPDVRQRRARSSTRSRRRCASPTATSTASATDLRAKRDLLAAGLTEAGFEVFQPAGHVLHHHRHPAPRREGRLRLLPRPARAVRRRRHPQRRLLRPPRRRPQPRPLRLLQAQTSSVARQRKPPVLTPPRGPGRGAERAPPRGGRSATRPRAAGTRKGRAAASVPSRERRRAPPRALEALVHRQPCPRRRQPVKGAAG